MPTSVLKFAAWIALMCFLASCTSIKQMDPAGSFESKEVKEKYALHLRDGRILTTKHMTVSDSTFALHSLLEDGKEHPVDPPMVIRRADVESMQHIKTNHGMFVLIVVGAGIAAYLLYKLLDDQFSDDPVY